MPGRFIDLRPGLHINVMPRSGALASSYDSVIRRVTAEGMRIDLPRRAEGRLQVASGEPLTLIVQLHGRVYTFDSEVLAIEEVPAEALIITRPSEVERGERRQFYRLLSSIVPHYCARVDQDGEEVGHIDAKILDLSGGGVQLLVHDWVPVGARLRMIFHLDDEPLDVALSVLALGVEDAERAGAGYRINGKFMHLQRSLQEQIIRYIFRQQMLLSQRRAG